MKIVQEKEIEIYTTRDGQQPFVKWLESVRNKQDHARILVRLDRIALGNLGDHKSISSGVSEIRFPLGPGYRIYYGEDGDKIILLLCGGDKSSQQSDIKSAKKYWRDYCEGMRHEENNKIPRLLN